MSVFPVRRSLEGRQAVLIAAGAMFGALLTVDLAVANTTDLIDVLYAVPVVLAALELGLLGGIGAALCALLLGVAGMLDAGSRITLADVVGRGIAFVVIGGVAGRFGERMRDAHRRQFLLLQSGLTLAHLDVADDLPAVLAAQARELIAARSTTVELTDGPAVRSGALRGKTSHDELPIEVRGTRYGTLAVDTDHPTTIEDHAMLAILALQAAVAAENRRLLVSERERARIRGELQDAQIHLAERGRQLRELILRQEAERYQLAYELNEQAAQSLAAVLLGLAVLERELGTDAAATRFGVLRDDVDSTLRSLRGLAVGLRPPLLMLGLPAALERLAERRGGGTFGSIEVALDGSHKLGEESETMVYRVVEEALDAVGAARAVTVRTRAGGSELVVDVEDAEDPIAQQRLAVLRARMDLVDGQLTATPTDLHVVIPLFAAEERAAAAS
jgi:hypothetical protein